MFEQPETISLTTYFAYLAILVIIFLLYLKFCKRTKKEDESSSESEEEVIKEREVTLNELKKYNGKDNEHKKCWVSVRGKVYDVTKSGFYGVGGPYNIFAGHDCSICLAKNSFDPSLLDKFDLSALKFAENETIDGYIQQFELKYDCIGWLKEYKDVNKDEKEEEEDDGKFSQNLGQEYSQDPDEKKNQ